MARARMIFPPDFRWGTSTSAYQVEGNNKNSDWWSWEEDGEHILDGHRSGVACNWWEDAERDLDQAADMGSNALRISLEWSRIEPEPSVFDNEALDRYRQMLQAMHARGLEPMVTLHHFSNPLWLVEKGDFNTDLVVDYFQRYTAKVVDRLGDLVPKWITINEPMVYIFLRYLTKEFPAPQKEGWAAAMRAVGNLLRCHAAAYQTIHEKSPQAKVGVAKYMAVFEPRMGGNMFDAWWARRISWVFNEMWMQSMVDGRLRWPVGRGSIPGLKDSFDFVGVDYYTRYYIKFPPRRGILEPDWGPDAVVSDGNYGEIYPAGLYEVLKRSRRYRKPIYITENGLPDEGDKHRTSFILNHLREVWRAISFSFPVMGYYHWSLIDNFEWHKGWTQRFGLVELNRESQERRWRASAHLYREICHTHSISSDMAEKYAPELMETLFKGDAPEPSNPFGAPSVPGRPSP